MAQISYFKMCSLLLKELFKILNTVLKMIRLIKEETVPTFLFCNLGS